VLVAGQEVEDGIVAFLRSQEQAKHLGESVGAAARTVEITNEQYNQGAVDFTPVFVFQQNLTEQQDAFAVAQGNIALSLIAIYRALGGGWQIRLNGNVPQVVEPETLELPFLEQMPLPGAGHDVQFESFPVQASFLDVPKVETDAQETVPCATSATKMLVNSTERGSS
jgi:hypothetical protein